jgi:hypothetical protein
VFPVLQGRYALTVTALQQDHQLCCSLRLDLRGCGNDGFRRSAGILPQQREGLKCARFRTLPGPRLRDRHLLAGAPS